MDCRVALSGLRKQIGGVNSPEREEHFGIEWRTPSQMNPRVMFD